MTNIYSLFFALTLIGLGNNTKELSTIEITYRELLDLNSPIPLEREAKLICYSDESLYYSARAEKYGLKGRDWKGNDFEGESFTSSSSSKDFVKGGLLYRTYLVDPFGNSVYISRKLNLIKVRSMDAGLTLVYEEPNIPKMTWNILHDSTMIIGKYHCIKANTIFKGRKYEVWFAPEVPINKGPWKLNGLPGLILKAKEMEGKISFEMFNIKSLKEKIDLSKDLDKWTGKICTYEESKTIGMEYAIKEWIKGSSLSHTPGAILKLNIDLNDYLERYPKEQKAIKDKYEKYLIVK